MKYLIPLFLVVLCSSCDYYHSFEYQVDNQHADTIVLTYYALGESRTDTFPPGSITTFYNSSSNKGKKALGDMRNEDNITLNYVNSTTSQEYLTEQYWTYTQVSTYENLYVLVVDSTVVQ